MRIFKDRLLPAYLAIILSVSVLSLTPCEELATKHPQDSPLNFKIKRINHQKNPKIFSAKMNTKNIKEFFESKMSNIKLFNLGEEAERAFMLVGKEEMFFVPHPGPTNSPNREGRRVVFMKCGQEECETYNTSHGANTWGRIA